MSSLFDIPKEAIKNKTTNQNIEFIYVDVV